MDRSGLAKRRATVGRTRSEKSPSGRRSAAFSITPRVEGGAPCFSRASATSLRSFPERTGAGTTAASSSAGMPSKKRCFSAASLMAHSSRNAMTCAVLLDRKAHEERASLADSRARGFDERSFW